MSNTKEFLKKRIYKSDFLRNIYDIYINTRTKLYVKKLNNCFCKNGMKTFVDLCEVLNKNNIKFWLCYGTLLGYVRENGILKHDFDFDIGLWYSDYSKSLENILLNSGFSLKRQFYSDSDYKAFEQTYEKNGVSIDFFYHYQDESKIWTHIFYREKFDELDKDLFRIRRLDYPKAPLEEVEFLHSKVYIPSNKEIYLEEIYGKNWRIPDPNYDWHFGPKNNCTVPNVYGRMATSDKNENYIFYKEER